MKMQQTQIYGTQQEGTKKEFYRVQAISKNKKRLKHARLIPKGTRKREQTKLKVSKRKKIIKIKAEINEIQIKKTMGRSMIKSRFFEKRHKTDRTSARLRKKETSFKYIKSEMKMLQLEPQKYKDC